MGISSKKRKSQRRKEMKRAAKATKKALYASYAGTGKRKKKQGVKRKGPSASRGNHTDLNCGNPGCERCFPQFRRVRCNMK